MNDTEEKHAEKKWIEDHAKFIQISEDGFISSLSQMST